MLKKIGRFIGYFFLGIWVLILVFCIISAHVSSNKMVGFALAVAWWIITIAVVFIITKIDTKKSQKTAKAYREKFITNVTITDETYGEIVFEFDSQRKQHISQNINLAEFAGNQISEITIDEYDETKKDSYFRGLDYVYENADNIAIGCVEIIKECYDDEDVRDENNELFSIETIKKQLCLDDIKMVLNEKGECEIEILGYMDNDIIDHINEHGVTASINCVTMKFDYYSG